MRHLQKSHRVDEKYSRHPFDPSFYTAFLLDEIVDFRVKTVHLKNFLFAQLFLNEVHEIEIRYLYLAMILKSVLYESMNHHYLILWVFQRATLRQYV